MNAMKTNTCAIALSVNNDIVEMHAHGRLYWATRKRFEDIEAVSRMIEIAMSRGATLATIQHIFDEPGTFEEVRFRFDNWSEGETAIPAKKRSATVKRGAKQHLK